MINTLTHLNPAVQASLARWHTMVQAKNLSGLSALLHPDAVFRSPMAHTPYGPAAALELILGTVMQVFEDLHGHAAPASTLLALRGELFELGEPLSAMANANLQIALEWGLDWIRKTAQPPSV